MKDLNHQGEKKKNSHIPSHVELLEVKFNIENQAGESESSAI